VDHQDQLVLQEQPAQKVQQEPLEPPGLLGLEQREQQAKKEPQELLELLEPPGLLVLEPQEQQEQLEPQALLD
jgi:hypothetical protein